MTSHEHHADGTPLLDATVLMDYWLASLPPADESMVETHLMTCDACGDRLRDTIALADGLRTLARTGELQVIIDDDRLARVRQDGLRVREYAPRPGEGVACTVSEDDDVLVARLAADLTGATRVDLSWCDLGGVEHQRMPDIQVRPGAVDVVCQQSITWAKQSPTVSMVARLLAVEDGGVERVIGEFTFHHERTIPGPPGWTLP